MSLVEVSVVVAVILVAVLVGTAIPPLLQLRSTLRSLETFLNETRPKLGAVLDQAAEATSRVNQAAIALEEGMGRVRGVLSTLEALGSTLESFRETVRKSVAVLAGIGPAVFAGFKLFFSPKEQEAAPAEDGDGAEKRSANDRGASEEAS